MVNKRFSILHIASDEKFINAANHIFEKAYPECNTFLIPKSKLNPKFKYIDVKDNFEFEYYGKDLIQNFELRTRDFDCVFLHGMTEINSSVYLMSKEKSKFIGMIWGGEMYTKENFPEQSFLGSMTASIQLNNIRPSLVEIIKNIIRKIVYRNNSEIINVTNQAVKTISCFAGLDIKSLDAFKSKQLISEQFHYVPFTYYPIEFIMKGNESGRINGNDILIGNSASLTNNHLEAFHILNRLNIEKRKVLVPLSYGDSLYADYIQENGYEIFNNNFESMRQFMSLDKYVAALQNCGIVIMNHYKSQAVGNILMMLWLGSKVYLDESNIFYHYLKSIGIKVYSINKELKENNSDALMNLSNDEVEYNRDILKKTIGLDVIVEKLKEAIKKYFIN